jgi:hypothetical protein
MGMADAKSAGTDMPMDSKSSPSFDCCRAGIGIDWVEADDDEGTGAIEVVVVVVVVIVVIAVCMSTVLEARSAFSEAETAAAMADAEDVLRPVVGVTLPAAEPVFCFLTCSL